MPWSCTPSPVYIILYFETDLTELPSVASALVILLPLSLSLGWLRRLLRWLQKLVSKEIAEE